MKKRFVLNSTPFILFSKINRLDLMNIMGEVLTTPNVLREVLEEKDIPDIERRALERFFKERVNIRKSSHDTTFDLGEGESSAISIAVEEKAIFVSDDKKARNTAKMFSLNVTGTIGIVLLNLKKKKITSREAKEILNVLISKSYRLSIEAYSKVLDEINKESKQP